ncbi:DUF4176 domain-containing protein [Pseudolactococcus yaeyamensis]
MNENILPLGTVVTLKNGDGSKLMIIARASIVIEEEKEAYYDYASVLIPQGMITPETVYFFNRENVEEVVFKGFQDYDEQEYEAEYDDMIANSKIPKGNIE